METLRCEWHGMSGNGRVEFRVSADTHRLIVQAQREFIDAIAERIASGKPFERTAERNLVAGILHAWARRIPDALPDDGSGTARVDAGFVAIHLACLVNGHGQTKAEASEELAKIYGVSPEAIGEAIEKFEGPAMRLVPKKAEA